MADIEERLKSHSSAFEGLLSLIPANKYFEGDSSSQWSKRKQTKEEHKRAKKAKLDPDSATTAAEFRKKRQHEAVDAAEKEVMEQQPKTKKPKKEKKPKAQQQQQQQQQSAKTTVNGTTAKSPPRKKKGKGSAPEPEVAPAPPAGSDEEAGAAPDAIQINGFAEQGSSATATDPALSSSTSISTTSSTTTSATITTTTSATAATTNPPKPTLSPAARAEQRARLAARIEALRASRKADNIDGSSARTRQELMEARRKKEALRRERKKAARVAAKGSVGAAMATTAATATAAATAAAPADSAAKSTANPVSIVKNFSFGRVTFDDGHQLDPTLTDFKKEKRRTGPRDLLGQLKHTEAKKRRIESMDDDKKEAVLEKEKWGKALKQASGEKVKDDEKLLKKALKRQEATKRKSSSEWSERLAGQAKAKSLRIKKREENIQARKDAKKAGKSGKKGGATKNGAKPGGKNGKKKRKASRPGFEGAMKTGGKGIPNGKGKK